MLIDSTLREGAQAYGVYLTATTRRRVAEMLCDAGVDEIECGWAGQPCLEEFLGWARARLPQLERGGPALSVWCPCRVADARQAASLGADRLNIGVPASAGHRQKRLGLGLKETAARLRDVLDAARAGGARFLSVGLEDASRANLSDCLALGRAAMRAGAARLRLSDTVGVLTPLSTARLVEAVRGELGAPVAFHGHNDLGMATANAVTALESGASFVDVSALGLGERAGIAALEEVAAWLALRAPSVQAYDLPVLRRLCALVAGEARVPLARNKAVAGEDVFAAESGLHVHGLLRDPSLFEPFAPESVGATRRIGVGAKSGRASVGAALDRLLQPSGGTAEGDTGLLERVRGLSGSLGRPLTDQELLGVV